MEPNSQVADDQTTSIVEPLKAPWRRKLLAIRVLLAGGLGLFLQSVIYEWITERRSSFPGWYWAVFIVLGLSIMFYLRALLEGAEDLAVHLFPGGRVRRTFYSAARSSQTAKEYDDEYLWALMPIILPGLLALIVMLIGGFSVLGMLWDSTLGSWPSWAIVIAFLLVLTLIKK